MNDLVQLGAGRFNTKPPSGGPRSRFPEHAVCTSETVRRVRDLITDAYGLWGKDVPISGVLIEAHFNRVIPKSLRFHRIFQAPTAPPVPAAPTLPGLPAVPVYGIVGIRYEDDGRPEQSAQLRHVITYYLTHAQVAKTLEELAMVADYLDRYFGGTIDYDGYRQVGEAKYPLPLNLFKTSAKDLLVDCLHVTDMRIPEPSVEILPENVVSLYQTELTADEVFRRINGAPPSAVIDGTTLLLSDTEFRTLRQTAPYLVAMSVNDRFDVDAAQPLDADAARFPQLPPPTGEEPLVGVLDLLFDQQSYVSAWVDDCDMVNSYAVRLPKDYWHGTAVTSLIVDGPNLNPNLEDGCGRFRVRHFGILQNTNNSLRRTLTNIEQIVEENADIHVWNLSIGTPQPVSDRFISPLAALLDRLQSIHPNLLFVVAGTNDADQSRTKRVGSAGDSLNSIVVNSCTSEGEPVLYARRGPVLSFFVKPDVATEGGDLRNHIRASAGSVIDDFDGTSFAAPWITRKAAYLMEVMGLSRETAKALIIDSTLSWNGPELGAGPSEEVGYGQVPHPIGRLIRCPNDEIRFIIRGEANSYESYTYDLPVPMVGNRFPFKARIVTCYMPPCDRRQGVDYTLTDLEAKFGPMRDGGNGLLFIDGIGNDYRDEPEDYPHFEGRDRRYKRKWDNVKVRIERWTRKMRGREKKAKSNQWGLSITRTERPDGRPSTPVLFASVITLKATDGKNHFHEFVQMYQGVQSDWVAHVINENARVRAYQKGIQDLKLE